ncbi:MAG: hypothetical protein HFJ40_02445 [Clostridia bacterium]|nr:hypothetical protein [Clostridia bacterium]
MGSIKNEYKSFLDDIEKNIKNKEDLEYIKKRLSSFVDVIVEKVDDIANYRKEEIEQLEERQNEIEEKMSKMQGIIDNIEKDIYAEEGFDFEIVCPYCENEFIIDVDENKTEVECPECSNIIELDWSGDTENDDHSCSGHCGGCSGCGDEDDDM